MAKCVAVQEVEFEVGVNNNISNFKEILLLKFYSQNAHSPPPSPLSLVFYIYIVDHGSVPWKAVVVWWFE